ncbi:MAG: tetratricopeptide repeat protein [Acidiferrobacterales bacterium]
MAGFNHVFSATSENFSTLVLQNSVRGPVMVNYWSPRAGPCMVLMPRLISLAAAYGGRFLLVTVNTDEHGPLAREHGVVSVPTVKMFRHGGIVDTIYGALAESEFRTMLERHLARGSDVAHVAAVAEQRAGNVGRARTLLAQAAMADPQNARIAADLAKLLILENKPAQAEAVLNALPPAAATDPQIITLRAHLRFLRAAAEAPAREVLERELVLHPESIDTRFSLSALRLVADDYAGAMDELIEILRYDRDCSFARAGLLAVFQIIECDRDLLARYRKRVSEAIA